MLHVKAKTNVAHGEACYLVELYIQCSPDGCTYNQRISLLLCIVIKAVVYTLKDNSFWKGAHALLQSHNEPNCISLQEELYILNISRQDTVVEKLNTKKTQMYFHVI